MALDPSLSLQVKPIEFPDQTNFLMKALQAQSLIGQNQLQGLQVQQGQQSLARTNALSNYFANGAATDDTATRNAKIMQLDPINGPGIVEKMLSTTKTQGDIDSAKTTHSITLNNRAASIVGSAAANGPDAVVSAIQNDTTLPDELKKQVIASVPRDQTFKQWAQQFQGQGMTPEQQLTAGRPGVIESPTGPVSYNKANPNGGFTVMQPTGTQPPGLPAPGGAPAGPSQGGMTLNQPTVGQQPIGNFAGDPSALVAQIQRIQDPNDRAMALRALQNQLAGANPTSGPNGAVGAGATGPVPIPGGMPPPMGGAGPQALGGASAAPMGLPSAPPVAAQPASNPFMKFETKTDPRTGALVAVSTTPGSDGNFVVKQLGADGGDFKPTTADQALIDQIGKGVIAYPSGNALRNPHTEQILAAVAQQYPNSSASDYPTMLQARKQYDPGGKQGATVRSLSVASDHLDTLSDAAAALQNGQYPLVNKIANAFNVQTGGTAVGSFNAVKQIVGDEVVKAVLGGVGGLGDREGIQKTFDDAKTPQDLSNVIQHYRTLMAAQKNALQADYENSTKRTDFAQRFNYSGNAKSAPAVPPDILAIMQKHGVGP